MADPRTAGALLMVTHRPRRTVLARRETYHEELIRGRSEESESEGGTGRLGDDFHGEED